MANPTLQPTGNAGEYFIPSAGVKIKLVEWREGDFYDTVTQASGAVTAGTTLELFRDLTNKNLHDTNLKKPRNIPAQSEFIMNRIGAFIGQAFSNTLALASDILKVSGAASLSFKINDRLIVEGPVLVFQSGVGMTGASTENAISTITTGVPSAAAAPSLLVSQKIGDADDLAAQFLFFNDSWITGSSVMPTLTGRVTMKLILHGFIKKPQGA